MPLGKYFILISDHCRLVLGIEDNSNNEQSLAVLCSKDGGEPHQIWFEDLATGTIRSKANDLCLTVSEGENRIRLKAYEPGDSKQLWMVDGKLVRHREDRNKVFDIVDGRGECGAVLCSWDFHSGTNQQWEVQYLEPRLFYIVSELNQNVVDVAYSNSNAGAKVIVWKKHESRHAKNQLWYEDQTGFLRSALNDFAPDGSTKEITMQPFDVNNPDRCWGIYGSTVFLKYRQDHVFDILDGRAEPGASVGVFKSHNGPNQKWYQEYIED